MKMIVTEVENEGLEVLLGKRVSPSRMIGTFQCRASNLSEN